MEEWKEEKRSFSRTRLNYRPGADLFSSSSREWNRLFHCRWMINDDRKSGSVFASVDGWERVFAEENQFDPRFILENGHCRGGRAFHTKTAVAGNDPGFTQISISRSIRVNSSPAEYVGIEIVSGTIRARVPRVLRSDRR